MEAEYCKRLIKKISTRDYEKIILTSKNKHVSINKFSIGSLKKVYVSSNINEGIRVVLFLLRKNSTRTKSTKTNISKRKQKRQF